MADISTALITYLKTISNITDLVGSGTSARIYHERIKQGVSEPFIRIELLGGISDQYLGGISGIATAEIQVDAFALSSADAFDLAEKIRLAPLQMFRGTMGAIDVLNVDGSENFRRGFDPPPNGGNTKRYYVTRDYSITYREAES